MSATHSLIESISYRTIHNTRKNHATFVGLAVASWFRNQGMVLGNRLDELNETNSAALFDDSAAKVDNERVTRSILLAYLAGMLFAKRSYALDMDYNMDNIHVLLYRQQHIPELLTQLNATSKQDMRDVITNGLDAELDMMGIRKQIKALFVSYGTQRSALIGSHESIAAFGLGQYAAVVDTGMPYDKLWLNVGDDKVEQECLDNTAQGWVSLHTSYNGGALVPPQHVGCRCAMDYRKV